MTPSIPDVYDSVGNTMKVYGILVAPLVLGGLWFVVMSLRRLVITDVGVIVKTPLWRDKTIPWDTIAEAEIGESIYTVHPVIRTTTGKTVNIYAVPALTVRDRSPATRAHHAIVQGLERHRGSPRESP